MRALQSNLYAKWFYDMSFVRRLSEALPRAAAGVSWACSGRVDDFDAAAAPLLAEAGCVRIFWGLESGSERGLRVINKRLALGPSVRKIREVSEKYLILSQVSFIYNFPGDDLESFKRTLELAFRLKSENPDKVQVALNNFLALSGAPFTRNAVLKKSRFLLRQMDLGPGFLKRVESSPALFSFFRKPGNITTLGEAFLLTKVNLILNSFPGTIAVLSRKYGLLDILGYFQKSRNLYKAIVGMRKNAGAALPPSLRDIFNFERLGAITPAGASGKKTYRLLETRYDPSDLSAEPARKKKRYLFFYRDKSIDTFELTPVKYERFREASRSGAGKMKDAVLEIGEYL